MYRSHFVEKRAVSLQNAPLPHLTHEMARGMYCADYFKRCSYKFKVLIVSIKFHCMIVRSVI